MASSPATIPAYPVNLPNPANSLTFAPAERRQFFGARALRVRPFEEGFRAFVKVEFLFNASQAAVFRDWWEVDLELGLKKFTALWPNPKGFVHALYRFRPNTVEWKHVGFDALSVSGECSVYITNLVGGRGQIAFECSDALNAVEIATFEPDFAFLWWDLEPDPTVIALLEVALGPKKGSYIHAGDDPGDPLPNSHFSTHYTIAWDDLLPTPWVNVFGGTRVGVFPTSTMDAHFTITGVPSIPVFGETCKACIWETPGSWIGQGGAGEGETCKVTIPGASGFNTKFYPDLSSGIGYAICGFVLRNLGGTAQGYFIT